MSEKNNIAPIDETINIVKYEAEDIKSLIYTIRGKQVMLDRDVAALYQYTTKNINKAMKRNIERFPEDFCFQLTEEEVRKLWFQSGTTFNNIKYRSIKYLPYAYTEQGISMLAGVLKNNMAIQISINIIRAFIEMRRFMMTNGQIFERLTNVEYKLLEQGERLTEHERKFEVVFNELQKKKLEEFKQRTTRFTKKFHTF